jgi:hypothetical protein
VGITRRANKRHFISSWCKGKTQQKMLIYEDRTGSSPAGERLFKEKGIEEKMKDSFVFYNSYAEAVLLLDSAESQMKTLKAIWDFAFRGIEPKAGELSKTEQIIYSMAKPTIEASIRSYENGKKGGRPSKNKETPLKTPLLTNDNDNVNFNANDNLNANDKDNANDTDNVNVNDTEKEKLNNNDKDLKLLFTPPSLKDVQQFCQQQKLKTDPVEFWTYYNIRKWAKIKNWQSQVMWWESRRFEKTTDYNSTESIPSV